MNLTLYEAGETSERVAFTCDGCGLDTVIHVGTRSILPEKRCLKCQGTLRSGRARPMPRGRIGTHEGRRKDRKEGATAAQQREVKRAASARNAQRRPGLRAKNGTTYRESCASYGCTHRKHQFRKSSKR